MQLISFHPNFDKSFHDLVSSEASLGEDFGQKQSVLGGAAV